MRDVIAVDAVDTASMRAETGETCREPPGRPVGGETELDVTDGRINGHRVETTAETGAGRADSFADRTGGSR